MKHDNKTTCFWGAVGAHNMEWVLSKTPYIAEQAAIRRTVYEPQAPATEEVVRKMFVEEQEK